MISPSPKQYGIIEVNRPAIGESGKRFLSAVQEDCRRFLGQVEVATMTNLELMITENGPDFRSVSRLILRDEFEISPPNELNLILLHRGVPKERARFYRTKEAAVGLVTLNESSPNHKDNHNNDVNDDALKFKCEQIAQEWGLNFNKMPIFFDRIAKLSQSPGRDMIFALLPDKTRPSTICSQAMAKEAEDSLALVNEVLSRVIPACGLNTKQGIAMPFARLPSNITKLQLSRLFDSWSRLVSPNKPLLMYLNDLQTIGR